jgi:hypothetical protein
MQRLIVRTLSMFMFFGLLMNGGSRALARKPSTKTAPQTNDEIEVVGHMALDGTVVTQITMGQHWRKNYVYLNSAEKITVIDVTDVVRPSITSEYHHPLPANESQVHVIVGNAALVATAPPAMYVPSSISIVSFSNPAAPKVVRQFTKVTGFLIDSRRGLIYVVNNEGLWILYEKPGRDLELEKQYDHDLMYNR